MPQNSYQDPALAGLLAQTRPIPGSQFQDNPDAGGYGDTAARLMLLLQQRKSELQDRVQNASAFGGDPRAAASLQDVSGDLSSVAPGTPLGSFNRQRITDTLADQSRQSAIQKGFMGAPGMGPTQQEAAAGRAAETFKAGMPLEVERARQAGEQRRFGQLQDVFKNIAPGSEVDLGGGIKYRAGYGVPPGAGANYQKELDQIIKDRTALDKPTFQGTLQDYAGNTGLGKLLGISGVAAQKKSLEDRFQALTGKPWSVSPSGTGAQTGGQDELRQRAVQALKVAQQQGAQVDPNDENHIQEAMRQLGGR